MPRLFVNSMANFVIQGGMVSFTLQDQSVSTAGGQMKPLPPEDVANIVMREADFAKFVSFLNSHVAAFEAQTGRSLGAEPGAGGAQQPQPQKPGAKPGAKPGGGLRIRPRED